jgi:serine/threonine protein phosphatase PrpC
LRQRFHEFFIQSVADSGSDYIGENLIRTFRKCDEELFSIAKEKGLSMNVGAVVNSVVIDQRGNIYCANLGDCRSVLSVDGNKIVELSRDLTPAVPEEADRIRRCGGFVSSANRVNGRLAVSRAIGDFEYKSDISGDGENMVSSVPEIRMHVSDGSERFIVMGCDGLYDVMTSKDVVNFVEDRISQFVNKGQHPDPSQICVDLVTECVIKRGTTDNVTVIVILLKDFISN